MSMSTISVRVDSDDKNRFESFCNNTGLNISTAINMYIKAVLINGSIPFEIRDEIPVSNDIPNNITANSIKEADKLIKEINQNEWKDIDEMKKDLAI